MLLEQLKSDYRQLVRVLTKEKQMREVVFLPGNPKRAEKLGEIDGALQALVRIKEMLKALLEINPDDEQQVPLLDMPAKRREL